MIAREVWPEVPIADLQAPKRWALNGGPFGSKLVSRDYVDTGVPVIRGANLPNDRRFSHDDLVFVSEEKADELLANNAHPGDVVFTQRGTLGQVGIIPINSPYRRYVISQSQMKLTVDESRVDALWLFYCFRNPTTQQEMINRASSSGVPHINLGVLREFRIRLPSLPEQRRIASILSAYDDLIENNTRRIAILEEMARRIYEEWFVRFRFPGHEGARMVECELGLVPEAWHQVTLADVCEPIEDGDWIETKDQSGDDYRLLQISNVGVNRFVETGNHRFISQETFKRLRCREILPGQLLIARMPTPIGRAWLVTPKPWKMVTAVDVAIATAETSKTSPEFLLHFLNSDATLASFATQASGTTRLRITRRQIAAMPLLAPPPALAHQFAKIIRPMNELAAVHSQRNDVLRTTRDLLLPKLISGELNVSAIPEPEALAA